MTIPKNHDGRSQTVPDAKFDYVLVGGGLQSGLIALALRHTRPDATFAIVERADRLAGNHTWSFHGTDVTESSAAWIDSVIEHRWADHDVRAGGRHRNVAIEYCTVSSEYFAERIERLFAGDASGCRLMLNTDVTRIARDRVTLADGRELLAECVIDNRGPSAERVSDAASESFPGGFQKFWGFELRLPSDWPLPRPVIIDDRVDQADGFRFVYTLPFEARRVLVEDTRFSNNASLDREECAVQVDAYLRLVTGGAIDLSRCEIVREESGVLPMPYRGFRPGSTGGVGGEAIAGGYRGGWFHAATGYSFPMALRLAEWVAATPIDRLAEKLSAEAERQKHRATFARLLNRMLFELVKPTCRYQIFRRFYRVLSEPRIARFYAHRFTAVDAARIVIGIPPGGLQPIRFFRSFRPETDRSTKVSDTFVGDGDATFSQRNLKEARS